MGGRLLLGSASLSLIPWPPSTSSAGAPGPAGSDVGRPFPRPTEELPASQRPEILWIRLLRRFYWRRQTSGGRGLARLHVKNSDPSKETNM